MRLPERERAIVELSLVFSKLFNGDDSKEKKKKKKKKKDKKDKKAKKLKKRKIKVQYITDILYIYIHPY